MPEQGQAMYSDWGHEGMYSTPDLGVRILNMGKIGRARSSSVSSRRSATGRRGRGPPPPQPLRPATASHRRPSTTGWQRPPTQEWQRPPTQQWQRPPTQQWQNAPTFTRTHTQQSRGFHQRRPSTAPVTRGIHTNKKGKGKAQQQQQKQFKYQWETSNANRILLSLISLTNTIDKSVDAKPALITAQGKLQAKLPEALEKLAKAFKGIAGMIGVANVSMVEHTITGVRVDSLENLRDDYNKLKSLLNHMSKEQKIASEFRLTAKKIATSSGVTLPAGFDTFLEITKAAATTEIKSLQQFQNIVPFVLFKRPDIQIAKDDGKMRQKSKKEFIELVTSMASNGQLHIKDIETLRTNTGFNDALMYVMKLTYSMLDEGRRIKEAMAKDGSKLERDTLSTRQSMLLMAYEQNDKRGASMQIIERADDGLVAKKPAPPSTLLQSAAERDSFLYSMMYPKPR